MFNFIKKKKTCQTIFQSSCKILPSPQQYGSSSYSAFSPALGIVIFIFSRCNRCVVESHCGFNLHFLMTNVLSIFPCVLSLGERSVQIHSSDMIRGMH